jgi:ribosomal protein S18 acetylase RimI-like enzyme
MNIEYREAILEDALGIAYVSAHSWQESYSVIMPDDYLQRRVDIINQKEESTKNFLKNLNGKYYVALDNNKVIGIMCALIQEDEKYKEYGEIAAIYVLKAYQGLGIGKELFRIGFNVLKEMGYNKVKLECLCGNKTIDFYKKYLGEVADTFDYTINNVGSFKADIVLFNDIDASLELLENRKSVSL